MIIEHKVLLVLVFLLTKCFSWWHGYDKYKMIPSYCLDKRNLTHNNNDKSIPIADYYDDKNHNVLTLRQVKKWKLWPGLISEFDQQHGETIFGFQKAMESIWKNQHPNNCSESKFLIAKGFFMHVMMLSTYI
jgi:hypothetical protein